MMPRRQISRGMAPQNGQALSDTVVISSQPLKNTSTKVTKSSNHRNVSTPTSMMAVGSVHATKRAKPARATMEARAVHGETLTSKSDYPVPNHNPKSSQVISPHPVPQIVYDEVAQGDTPIPSDLDQHDSWTYSREDHAHDDIITHGHQRLDPTDDKGSNLQSKSQQHVSMPGHYSDKRQEPSGVERVHAKVSSNNNNNDRVQETRGSNRATARVDSAGTVRSKVKVNKKPEKIRTSSAKHANCRTGHYLETTTKCTRQTQDQLSRAYLALESPQRLGELESSDECYGDDINAYDFMHSPRFSAISLYDPSDVQYAPQDRLKTNFRTECDIANIVDFEDESEDDIDDAMFESDEDKQDQRKARDSNATYERACRLVGVAASRRVAHELEGTRVYLDYASLNTEDIKAICIALLGNTTVSHVDLSGNKINERGARYISELINDNIFISHLFCATCQLEEEGVAAILDSVIHSKNITVLDLSENKLQDTQVEMVATLLKTNTTLRELRLRYCDIDEVGGKILSEALADSSLEIVDLSWNQLRQKGGTEFCLALANNDSIRQLDLSWNGLGREGCAGLEVALSKNKYLIQLDLSCNRVDTACLLHLLKGLETNKTLETLVLLRNPISTEDAKLIGSALKDIASTAIKVVDISDTTVDDDFLVLQEALQLSRGISIYSGNVLNRRTKEVKQGPRTLASFDPILVLFEYMKQQNLRLIDLFRSLDLNHDNSISKAELRNGFLSLNMQLPEGVLSAAFDKLDLNGNNLIDIDELKNAHRRVIRQTAMLMIRSQKRDDGYGDVLKEFQRLVREAANKRKIPRPNDDDKDENDSKLSTRRLSSRPGMSKRRVSTNSQGRNLTLPGEQSPGPSSATRRPSANTQSQGTRRYRHPSASSNGSSPRSTRSISPRRH